MRGGNSERQEESVVRKETARNSREIQGKTKDTNKTERNKRIKNGKQVRKDQNKPSHTKNKLSKVKQKLRQGEENKEWKKQIK